MDRTSHQIRKLLDSGLSARYVAEFLCIDISQVARATKLVPVTRPFPNLKGLTDEQRIVVLGRHGISSRKIQRYLSKPRSAKRISAYLTTQIGPMRRENNSLTNQIEPSLMPLIHELLKELGKNRYQCELCLDPVAGGCVVHHTKYEGATLYDLMYICQSCNLARENKGLA